MPRLATVLLALVPVVTVACSGDAEPPHPADESSPSLTSQGQTPGLGSPSPATALYGVLRPPLRGPDGSFLIALGPTWPAERTQYRVFDADWRPLTPLMHVPFSLSFVRGTPDGFLAQASKYNRAGNRVFPPVWLTVTTEGDLRPLDNQPDRDAPPRPLGRRSGLLGLMWSGLAYDHKTSSVFRWQPPARLTPLRSSLDFEGNICAARGHEAPVALLASSDHGRTVQRVPVHVSLAQGARVLRCIVSRKRLAVMTSLRGPHGAPRDVRMHLLTWTGRHLAEHALDCRMSPDAKFLPDGRLLIKAPGRGLLVGTDPTNQRLVHRPALIGVAFTWEVVGSDIYATPAIGHRQLWVSHDAARTWQPVDVQLDDLPNG